MTEELDSIDIDDIGNFEDLLRIVFIHEGCGYLKVFVGGGELTRNINEKIIYSVTNVLCESISAVSMWNIENH